MTLIYSAHYEGFRPFSGFARNRVVRVPADLTEKKGILILHGGADISPTLYNEAPIPENQGSTIPSERDKQEAALIEAAIQKEIPIFGICRGAQFLCISAGGALWQDVTNHAAGDHEVKTYQGTTFDSNSCHHQMMKLDNTNHELLAWAPNRSKHYKNESGVTTEQQIEPEVVWFPDIKGFAVQGHPEWLTDYHPYVQWLRSEFFKRVYAS